MSNKLDGLPAILREAAAIINGDQLMRGPILDELEGFARKAELIALPRAGIAAPTGQQAKPVAWANPSDIESDQHIDCWAYKTPHYSLPLYRYPVSLKTFELVDCGTCGCQVSLPVEYCAAPVSAAPAAPTADLLNADELTAFHRFCECCEDFDSGGYDLDKDMMARLARIGAVRSTGFGRYETTAFGDTIRSGGAAPTATVEPSKLDAGYVLMHSRIAGDLLMKAKQILGGQWNGALDDALNHIDYVRVAVESAPTAPQSQQEGAGEVDVGKLANRVRDLIADHLADNWPMVRYHLEEVEEKVRAINADCLLSQADAALSASTPAVEKEA